MDGSRVSPEDISTYEDLLPCPFVPGPMITDPRLFVGRKETLAQIIARMEGVQPISVNVVGERRIGKSSLLYHFFQTWQAHVRNPDSYVVIYLNLQSARAHKRETFYSAVADSLCERPSVQRYLDVVNILSQRPLKKDSFEMGVGTLKKHGLLPVFCLDEFEALFRHPQEFDDGFYDSLRALMNDGLLMLVAASQKALGVYRSERRLTSRFFNDGHVLPLGAFNVKEAADLVHLPASTVPGAPKALTPKEQRLALRWGGSHPCRLQIAAWAICQARLQGKDKAWARIQFEAQVRNQLEDRSSTPSSLPMRLSGLLRWFAWHLPRHLGQLARRTGEVVDALTNWILGIVVIVIAILVLVGILNGRQVLDLVRSLLER